MCGITGIIGLDSNHSKGVIQEMTDAMVHRGPDAKATYTEGIAALGHVRLSIIDLSNGANQPFFSEDKRYVMVFNGEIYNYEAVRASLNYNWKTHSDTEVILAAYIQYGKDCLQHLNGMFAFAIWDTQNQTLFMARDRMGIKPFYYTLNKGVFAFASEIRSLLKSGICSNTIESNSLYDYLNKIAVKTPNTILKGVYQLLPGHWAEFKSQTFTTEAYWKLAKPIEAGRAPKSFDEAKQQVKHLFDEAIKSRMVADVKVGAFLSGGIDSSAVVAAMAKNSKTPVETFSIIFDEKEFDESEYARMIAEKYKTKHTEITLKPEKLIEELPHFFKALDSPTVDGINTFLVSKLVKETGIKVVLTGLGGDELFAGYKNFKRWKTYHANQWLINNPISKLGINVLKKVYNNRAVAKIKDLQDNSADGFEEFYNNSRSIFLKKELELLLGKNSQSQNKNWIDLNSKAVNDLPVLSQYSVAEMSNYTLDVLIKDTDQMSMAWALEVREPFFDYHLIEYVLGVKDEYKLSDKTPKYLLVEALGDWLPPEIVYRPKKGFSFPWDLWLRNELKTYCEDAIQQLAERGLFDKKHLINYWERFLNHDKTITWTHIWSFVVLEKWISENDIKTN
jgi:asparagine synthase (glutamine-hydrolysing)